MRAERGQKAPRQGEILDRLRNPVQRAEDLTPRDGVIGLPRLRQKLVPRPKRDDRVDGGVGPLDVVEIGRHHLLGANLAPTDHVRQRDGAEGAEFGKGAARSGGIFLHCDHHAHFANRNRG